MIKTKQFWQQNSDGSEHCVVFAPDGRETIIAKVFAVYQDDNVLYTAEHYRTGLGVTSENKKDCMDWAKKTLIKTDIKSLFDDYNVSVDNDMIEELAEYMLDFTPRKDNET